MVTAMVFVLVRFLKFIHTEKMVYLTHHDLSNRLAQIRDSIT